MAIKTIDVPLFISIVIDTPLVFLSQRLSFLLKQLIVFLNSFLPCHFHYPTYHRYIFIPVPSTRYFATATATATATANDDTVAAADLRFR